MAYFRASPQSVSAYIVDACPTCRNANSIDLSVAAFQAIASLSEGIVPSMCSFGDVMIQDNSDSLFTVEWIFT